MLNIILGIHYVTCCLLLKGTVRQNQLINLLKKVASAAFFIKAAQATKRVFIISLMFKSAVKVDGIYA
ncbi:hypothetical protein HK11_05085 [Acetobacter sp. DmW_043]|nr:hypothetical protein HK11_05085 [Acetobacter sp. DmW_043]